MNQPSVNDVGYVHGGHNNNNNPIAKQISELKYPEEENPYGFKPSISQKQNENLEKYMSPNLYPINEDTKGESSQSFKQ